MRFYNWIFVVVLLSSASAFSQKKYTEHRVSKGETISQIADQYKVKQSAIYELNPDARKGIKFKGVLLIPAAISKSKNITSEIVATSSEKKHTVLPKETLYGIAKQYGVTVEEIQRINPTLQSGLKKGDKIKIPVTESNQSSVALALETVTKTQKSALQNRNTNQKEEANLILQSNHPKEVAVGGFLRETLPQETKYSIAKEYGITVADLDRANPILETDALKIGQKITIPAKITNSELVGVDVKEIKEKLENVAYTAAESKKTKVELIILADKSVAKPETSVIMNAVPSAAIVETEVVREVLAKETKYGIAKEYGISVKELERQNPNIARRLPIGYKLNIRSNKAIEPVVLNESLKTIIEEGNSDSKYVVKSFHGTDFLDQLVSTASENIGTRYRLGGTTKDGFDCSGLMLTTFSNFDIQLPRTSIEQSQYGVKVDTEDAQKGDLIFFKTNGRRQINHVGMVVEAIDGDIKFIHASVSGGVMISSIKEKYYKKKVTQVNRVL